MVRPGAKPAAPAKAESESEANAEGSGIAAANAMKTSTIIAGPTPGTSKDSSAWPQGVP